MSASISRKKRRKTIRQQRKDDIKWYTRFYAEDLENEQLPHSAYTLLTSQQIIRLTQGVSIRRK